MKKKRKERKIKYESFPLNILHMKPTNITYAVRECTTLHSYTVKMHDNSLVFFSLNLLIDNNCIIGDFRYFVKAE